MSRLNGLNSFLCVSFKPWVCIVILLWGEPSWHNYFEWVWSVESNFVMRLPALIVSNLHISISYNLQCTRQLASGEKIPSFLFGYKTFKYNHLLRAVLMTHLFMQSLELYLGFTFYICWKGTDFQTDPSNLWIKPVGIKECKSIRVTVGWTDKNKI